MKHFLLPIALLTLALSACGGKSSSPETAVDTTEVPLAVEQGPGHDDKRQSTANAEFSGHQYAIEVSCAPDDSLPAVKDRFGDPYLDNRVWIKVMRDGSLLTQRSVVKAQLAAHLEGADAKKLILGGVAFSAVDASGLHFGAQLNGPGDEEGGLAFKLTLPLSGQGDLVVKRDAMQDIEAEEDAMD